MRLESGQEPLQKILDAIFAILEKNTLLALSTFAVNEVWTSTVFYAYDKKLNFYFVSEPGTRHCQMIAKNKNVSGAIYPSDSLWGTDIQGIQFEAVAERVPVTSVLFHGAHYLMRFPVAKKFISSPKLLLSDKMAVRLYQITPRLIQIYDEVTITEGEPIRRIIFD